MFFLKNQYRVIEQNQLWYVETPTGYEGPFDDKQECHEMTLRPFILGVVLG